jgi:hypothetical protein
MLQLAVSQMLYGAVPSHDRVRPYLDEHGDRLHDALAEASSI